MSTPILEVKALSHQFDYPLFSQIDFALYPSQSVAIIGRSGSGKSTLLHIFSTFLKPLSGEVELLGHPIYAMKNEDIERLRRYDIGIVFQFHYLFKGMSALENIEVATMLSGEEIDDTLLERLEIKELMGQKITELSGGQLQRVSLARVLNKHPKVIFADEPTGNLDKETARLVMDVLLEYVEQRSAGLVLVTHDEEMAKRCEKIYQLEDLRLQSVQG